MKFFRFVLRRILNGLIAYLIIILTFTLVLNAFLDLSVRMQLNYMVSMSMKGYLDSGQGIGKSQEELAEVREQIKSSIERAYDLDKPVLAKTISRTWKTALWQFGVSSTAQTSKKFHGSRMVKDIILEALPNTLILFIPATLMSLVIGVLLGVKKAQHLNSWFDKSTSMLTMLFSGTPPWWIASLLVLLLSVQWNIFPFGSLHSIPPPETDIGIFFDRIYHMLLPILSILLVRMWSSAFMVKSLLLPPMQEDYIQAARGRGIPEGKVVYGHALRTASPGISTMSILLFVSSFSGDIILEKVLAWPGLGRLLWNATNAFNPDVQLIYGISTVLALIYCIAIVLLDILYVYLDPRIQY